MNALIQFRIDSDEKQKLEQTLKTMGLDIASAFKLFAAQVIRQRRIPFEIVADELEYVPNEETTAVLRDIENGVNMEKFTLEQLINEREKGVI